MRRPAPLLLVSAALLFFDFGSRVLANNDETRFPVLARDILEHGHWLLPRLQDAPHLNKPPLTAWLIALASWPTGVVTQSSAVLPSLLAALGVVLTTFWIARRLFDAAVAVMAGLTAVTTYGLFFLARVPMPDMPLCAAATTAMAAYVSAEFGGRRSALVTMYVLVAIGFWTKGLVGFLPLVVVLVDTVLTYGRSGPGRLVSPTGLALLGALVGPWWLLAAAAGRQEFVQDILLTDWLRWYVPMAGWTWRRLTEPVFQALTILLPWSLVFPLAVYSAARVADPERARRTRLLLAWAATMFLLAAVSEQQRMRYYLPLCPPAAILIAAWFAAWRRPVAVFASAWVVVAVGLGVWQARAGVRHNAETDLGPVADVLQKDPRPLYALEAPELVFEFYLERPVVVLRNPRDVGRAAADGYLVIPARVLPSLPASRRFREVAVARVGGRPIAVLAGE